MSKKLQFDKNGRFVLMQVSDTQDLHNVRPTMIRMLNKAYDRIRPDFVVFTGDNILGNHLRDARFGNRHVIHTKQQELERMKRAIAHIIEPLEKRKIPFTMIYGNHDDMNEITKAEQADIYRSYSMCRGLNSTDSSIDVDTFDLPLYSSDGKKKLFNFWLFDSAYMDKSTGKCHTTVSKSTVDWYIKRSQELKKENNNKPLPSIMFQHIPMPESACLMRECSFDNPKAVHFYDKEKNKDFYFCLDETKAEGEISEPIKGYSENNGQLEAIKQQGDVIALVYGHEHKNNYIGYHDGLKIIQTSTASFRCYGNHLRGVRVFEFDEEKPSEFNTYFLTYDDICGKGMLSRLAYIFDADGMEKEKYALLAASAVGVGALAFTGAYIYRLLKKQ